MISQLLAAAWTGYKVEGGVPGGSAARDLATVARVRFYDLVCNIIIEWDAVGGCKPLSPHQRFSDRRARSPTIVISTGMFISV